MSELALFSSKIVHVRPAWFDFQRYPFHHFQPVTAQADYFTRIIGDELDFSHSQVEEDQL